MRSLSSAGGKDCSLQKIRANLSFGPDFSEQTGNLNKADSFDRKIAILTEFCYNEQKFKSTLQRRNGSC